MRQRNASCGKEEVENESSKRLSQRIAEVDFFSKPLEDYRRQQTTIGGFVSFWTVVFISCLVAWEGISYCLGRDAYVTNLAVDTNVSNDMDVHVDIIFPNLPCHWLSIDILDSTGMRKFNFSSSIYKLPLGRSKVLLDTSVLDFLFDEVMDDYTGTECRHCPSDVFDGVSSTVREKYMNYCCNSCDAVMDLYTQFNKSLPLRQRIPQCLENMAEEYPGCRVVGTLVLKKVLATVVFGPRRTHGGYFFADLLRVDASHIINRFTIGDTKVKRFSEHGVAEPLTGHQVSNRLYFESRYYVKVIPTTYVTKKTQNLTSTTFEYSAQSRFRKIILGTGVSIPGVYFSFESSAFQINNIFRRPPFTRFLVQLCGLVGGVFVVLGFVDRAVERVIRLRAS